MVPLWSQRPFSRRRIQRLRRGLYLPVNLIVPGRSFPLRPPIFTTKPRFLPGDQNGFSPVGEKSEILNHLGSAMRLLVLDSCSRSNGENSRWSSVSLPVTFRLHSVVWSCHGCAMSLYCARHVTAKCRIRVQMKFRRLLLIEFKSGRNVLYVRERMWIWK